MQLIISAWTLVLMLGVGLLGPAAPEVLSADLKPKTLEAFSRYVRLREAAIQKELARPGEFLYVEGLPAPRRAQILASLKRGEIFMERLHVQDGTGHEIQAPGGIIHHWIGAVYIPGANLHQTLQLVQDYDHHHDIYKPEVVRSRLLTRDGNDFKIYYRLRKHKVITITLNTEHDVRYFPDDPAHCHSRSIATRIAEVTNADTPNEHEKPIGHDGGFLWRMNSYWRFEEGDGGVYVECESISLTRDIPTGLGWLIRPFITDIPKESLQMSLGSTRATLEARLRGQARQASSVLRPR
jgi:hypothetical protein